MKKLTSTQETLRAAMISRRSLLKASAALGAVGLASPLYVKNAFSSSGEINLLMWSDEFPDPVIPNFEKTGHQGQSDAVLAERRADQQAAGDRRRRLRPLPADARPRAAVQGSWRSCALRHEQGEECRQPDPLNAGRLDQRLDMGRRTLSPAACLGSAKPFPGAPTSGRAIPRHSPMVRCGKKA